VTAVPEAGLRFSMSSSSSSPPPVIRAVQFLNGTLSVTFSSWIDTDVKIVFDPHHNVIQDFTTMVPSSHTAQDNFSSIFSNAVFSTSTNVVPSDISPRCSLAPQPLPSLSSLIFPLLPLLPRSSLTPDDNDPTDVELKQFDDMLPSTSLAADSKS